MVPNEKWQCDNCFHVGPLSIHGRCEACGSEAVISEGKLKDDKNF